MKTGTGRDLELPSLCDALLSVLKREIAVYEKLFETVFHERTVLVKPSLAALMESNSHKEGAIAGVKSLENARQSIIGKMAVALRMETGQVQMSTIASAADPERKAALQQCQADLTSLFLRIRELNDRNKSLIEASLSYVRNSIELIATLITTGSDYVKTGQLRSDPLRGRILHREG